MGLLQGGSSLSSIHQEYGINKEQLHVLWKKYERFGSKGLHKKNNIKADFALKKRIMLDIEKNHITLHAAALKYGASYTSIYVWHQQYRKGGLAALKSTKSARATTNYGKIKKGQKTAYRA